MSEVDFAKIIECLIFVTGIMTWGAFLMFIFAKIAYRHWLRIELDKQRSEHYETDKAAICMKKSSQQS